MLGSVERDLEAMELHFRFVASISVVLSMFTILDISYLMIFRMIWIFRGSKHDFNRRANGVLSYLLFVLLKS